MPPVQFNSKIDFIRNEERAKEEVESRCSSLDDSKIVKTKKRREMTPAELKQFKGKYTVITNFIN